MAKRLALAGVLARNIAFSGIPVLDYRTDLLTPGQVSTALVYDDLDRPGLSIADELDAALFRARAGQAHEAATRG